MESPEWDAISKETNKALMKRCCDLVDFNDFDSDDEQNLSESEPDE